jgi:hypothetical protein
MERMPFFKASSHGGSNATMRDFRRLPSLLRVASILGLLFSLASLVLFAAMFGVFITTLRSSLQPPVNPMRTDVIALNLGMLGGACIFAVNAYRTSFRQTDRRSFRLNSWQGQLRTIGALATLPLCALMLAVVIPQGDVAFLLTSAVSMLAAAVLLGAYLWMSIWTGTLL